MGITAGIEKFYTFSQFFTVLFLTISALIGVGTTVFFLVRAAGYRRKGFFIILSFLFIFFILTETALSVSPAHISVIVETVLNCTALYLLSRVFFLFSSQFRSGKTVHVEGTPPFFILLSIEAAAIALLVAVPNENMVFFSHIDHSSVVPGPLFFLLVSLSSGWVFSSIPYLLHNFSERSEQSRKSVITASSALVAALCGFILHHILPGNLLFPLFPPALLLSVTLFSCSLLRFNLLKTMLFPVDKIFTIIEQLILVADENGRIIFNNRGSYGPVSLKNIHSISDLYSFLRCRASDSVEEQKFSDMENNRGAFQERICLSSPQGVTFFEYRQIPVVYMRRRIGYLLTFFDITADELSIRELENKKMELQARYDELTLYSNTTLYHETEKIRMGLMNDINSGLKKSLCSLKAEISDLADDSGFGSEYDRTIENARQGLRQVRRAVAVLKDSGKGNGGCD